MTKRITISIADRENQRVVTREVEIPDPLGDEIRFVGEPVIQDITPLKRESSWTHKLMMICDECEFMKEGEGCGQCRECTATRKPHRSILRLGKCPKGKFPVKASI